MGGQFRFDGPGVQRRLDVLKALFFETLLFVIFARKSLHHSNGREHFLDDGEQLAFFLAHFA